MLCGRGDGGMTEAWRQGQDCSLAGGAAVGLSSGQGWSEGRFCGDLGREDGGGICSGKEYVRGSQADGGERRRCCEGGLCERLWWGRGCGGGR